jgi:transketolase N-terminal domain/subunit
MVARANASHIGTCLSMADLLAVLYARILRHSPADPSWPERDRFLLSKGHGAAIVYALLAELGYFPKDWLERYCENGSPLTGHVSHFVPGVELSTGSLGHALSVGAGMAVAARADGLTHRVFVLLSDGELDEGSNWEPILFAGHHRLGHLAAIVDYNKIQSFGLVKDVLDLEPLDSEQPQLLHLEPQPLPHHYSVPPQPLLLGPHQHQPSEQARQLLEPRQPLELRPPLMPLEPLLLQMPLEPLLPPHSGEEGVSLGMLPPPPHPRRFIAGFHQPLRRRYQAAAL